MAKLIKILKPGKFVDKFKTTVEFSSADLQAIATAYNPDLYACPLTIGHPESDTAPSYGKLAAVSFADSPPFLLGDPSAVEPLFAKIVNQGHYTSVSLSMFTPTHPANPVPGIWYPRHLAFLGAVPPAVPGLGTVSFTADDGCVEFSLGKDGIVSLGDYEDTLTARLLRSLKNFMAGKYGQDEADKAIPEWDLQYLTEEAARPDIKPGTCACCGNPCDQCCCPIEVNQPAPVYMSAPTKESSMKLTEEQITTKTAELDLRENNLLARENTRIHGEHVSFATGLTGKENMRVLPCYKDAIVGVLDQLAGVSTADTVSFSVGDVAKTLSPLETLKTILSGQPKIVSFSEEVLGGNAAADKTMPRSEFTNLSADEQSAFCLDGGTVLD